jgi:predicted dehydrogenase
MVAGKQVSYELPVPKCDGFFEKKITSFVDAVKDGGKPTVPSSQAIINQAIIDGIIKSNELGHEIEIEIPEI